MCRRRMLIVAAICLVGAAAIPPCLGGFTGEVNGVRTFFTSSTPDWFLKTPEKPGLVYASAVSGLGGTKHERREQADALARISLAFAVSDEISNMFKLYAESDRSGKELGQFAERVAKHLTLLRCVQKVRIVERCERRDGRVFSLVECPRASCRRAQEVFTEAERQILENCGKAATASMLRAAGADLEALAKSVVQVKQYLREVQGGREAKGESVSWFRLDSRVEGLEGGQSIDAKGAKSSHYWPSFIKDLKAFDRDTELSPAFRAKLDARIRELAAPPKADSSGNAETPKWVNDPQSAFPGGKDKLLYGVGVSSQQDLAIACLDADADARGALAALISSQITTSTKEGDESPSKKGTAGLREVSRSITSLCLRGAVVLRRHVADGTVYSLVAIPEAEARKATAEPRRE